MQSKSKNIDKNAASRRRDDATPPISTKEQHKERNLFIFYGVFCDFFSFLIFELETVADLQTKQFSTSDFATVRLGTPFFRKQKFN